MSGPNVHLVTFLFSLSVFALALALVSSCSLVRTGRWGNNQMRRRRGRKTREAPAWEEEKNQPTGREGRDNHCGGRQEEPTTW